MATLKNEAIQAFPIHAGTYNGTASSLMIEGRYNVVHASADGTLTFTFPGSNSIVIDVKEGQDFAIAPGCISLTSSANVIVS